MPIPWLELCRALPGLYPIELVPPPIRAYLSDGMPGEDAAANPPLPPLPPSAPACARQWIDETRASIAAGLDSARQTCWTGDIAFRFEFLPWSPLPYRAVWAPWTPGYEPYWYDPCLTDYLVPPDNCPYLEHLFQPIWPDVPPCQDDPEHALTSLVSPTWHAIAEYLCRPGESPPIWVFPGYEFCLFGRLFRLWQDLPGAVDGDLDERACLSYQFALSLQVQAAQQLMGTPIAGLENGTLAAVADNPDGIQTGKQIRIGVPGGVETFNIGLTSLNSLIFCQTTERGIIAPDVGWVACQTEEDMGCDCEQIQSIIQDELLPIKDDIISVKGDLEVVKEKVEAIDEWVSEVKPHVRRLFDASDDAHIFVHLDALRQMWTHLTAPSEGDIPAYGSVVLPPTRGVVLDGLGAIANRITAIASWLDALGASRAIVLVTWSIEGERVTSRDSRLHGDRHPTSSAGWPYNHYGQYRITVGDYVSPWAWIRAREAADIVLVPRVFGDQRPTPSIEIQCYEGLRVAAADAAWLPDYPQASASPPTDDAS